MRDSNTNTHALQTIKNEVAVMGVESFFKDLRFCVAVVAGGDHH